jgi:hypothetical protein
MYIMGLLKNFLGIFNLFLGNMYVIKDELDPFEEIYTNFLVKKVRSEYYLAKNLRIRIHNTGFSVPDFLKRKLMVDTTISDLHRFHYGFGYRIQDRYGSKTLVGTPTVRNALVASI